MKIEYLFYFALVVYGIWIIYMSTRATYLSWFHPENLRDRYTRNLKGDSAYINFFRRLYNSNGFIWYMRIQGVFFLLVISFAALIGILALIDFLQ
jgi:hypothetical protein